MSHSALVQLFDPLQSPRCYAVVGIKDYSLKTKAIALLFSVIY